MSRMLRFSLLFTALLAGANALAAVPVPPAPPVDAASYVLIDFQTGRILAEKNDTDHRSPASTTKLMTAYVVFQDLASGQISLDTKFGVSKKAWKQIGSRMFLKPGSQVSVNELLQGMLIPSGNDAAMTLAEGVAGTEAGFVNMMNANAKALGLTDTRYYDPAGLDGRDYTSALDLAKLSRAIIRDFPQYYHYFSEKEFTWNKIHQYNWNKLLWLNPSSDGLKTGFTADAGYCLAASAKQGDQRMIAVVMGVPSVSKTHIMADYRHLAQVSESLLDYGFRFYDTHQLYAGGKVLGKVRVWKGADKYVSVGPAKPFYVTAARGHFSQLKITTQLKSKAPAPVKVGQILGKVTVTDPAGKVVASTPLVAQAQVGIGGMWAKIRDTVLGWF
ncbi:MAG: D-alanyl-D-alanine carboxypeptidase family protein [Gammaproteobacteria bacterium]